MKRAARGEAIAEAKDSLDSVVGTSMGCPPSGLGAAVCSSALAGVFSPAGAAAGVVAAAAGGGGSSSASPLRSWPSQTSPIGQPLQAREINSRPNKHRVFIMS